MKHRVREANGKGRKSETRSEGCNLDGIKDKGEVQGEGNHHKMYRGRVGGEEEEEECCKIYRKGAEREKIT